MFLIDVTSDFDAALKEVCKQPDYMEDGFLDFVLKHERKQRCLRNLCDQILKAEFALKMKFDSKKRLELIHSVAGIFVAAAHKHREQYNWTAMQRSRELNKDNLRNEVAQLIKEVPSASETHQKGTPQ